MPSRLTLAACVMLAALPALGQPTGAIKGKVALRETGTPLHGASVLVVELDASVLSEDDGTFEFRQVPPGNYHVVAHLDDVFTENSAIAEVHAGEDTSVDILLSIVGEKVEVTVTAADSHETQFESFASVESLDTYDLADMAGSSLGETLDHRVGTGIAKRSFGPGNARPIIRGFDGDRVLIMEDGIRTGTLSSQSGDHGEVMNTALIDRLEIVKGPATLLYSGNAMGGTVNAISRHHAHHPHPHEGMRGFVSGTGGSNNATGGGGAGFELGKGRVLLWGSAGAMRSGDYRAPGEGVVFNSRSALRNGSVGLGWYGERMYLAAETEIDRGNYGIPFAAELHGDHGHGDEPEDHMDEKEHEGEKGHEDEKEHEGEDGHDSEEEELERVAIAAYRQKYRVTWGLQDMPGAIESFRLKLGYVDWRHDEIEHVEDGHEILGTRFDNRQFISRGVFEQAERGVLSGRFGFWSLNRDYSAEGEEALSPPVTQRGLALFALEELSFERFKIQFGGRLETQRYRPAYAERGEPHGHEGEEEDHHEKSEEGHKEEGHEAEEHREREPQAAIDRSFTGASAAVGIHVQTWEGGALVANYSRSYRAPSLEELYNFGPHVGSLAFELGNPMLEGEQGNGVDISLRQQRSRVQAEFNFFAYDFKNFIFPTPTGESRGQLREIEFLQRDARYTGAEAAVRLGLRDDFSLNLGMDVVDARDTNSGMGLPRIPPLRGKVGFDFRKGPFKIAPQLVLANRQTRTFDIETPTAGYAVVNLIASYTLANQHVAHRFSVNVFNIGDRLYRNHSSFIKDLAPEIGRGVRFTYMLRFF